MLLSCGNLFWVQAWVVVSSCLGRVRGTNTKIPQELGDPNLYSVRSLCDPLIKAWISHGSLFGDQTVAADRRQLLIRVGFTDTQIPSYLTLISVPRLYEDSNANRNKNREKKMIEL